MNQAPSGSNSNNPGSASKSPGINPLNVPNVPVGGSGPQPYTPVFTTDKIQHTKATRPKEYFDEQNRKNAEKKKRDTKNRRNIIIIGAAILGALALIGLIWFVVIKIMPVDEPTSKVPIPVMTDGSNEEISEVRKYLQAYYGEATVSADNNSPEAQTKLNEAEAALDRVLAEPGGEEYKNQILLAQLQFLVENSLYSEASELDGKIDTDALSLEQRGTYYNFLAQTYSVLGDSEKSQEYFKTSIDILVTAGGIGG